MKIQTILSGLMGLSLVLGVLGGSVSAQQTYVLTVQELNRGLQKAPSLQQKGFFLVDVRTGDEHMTGFIPGTDGNIDFREIGRRHLEIGAKLDDHIVVYCQSGHRSNIAAETLAGLGYRYVYKRRGEHERLERGRISGRFPRALSAGILRACRRSD